MKRSLFIILGTLCFAIAGKAQGSDVSAQKKYKHTNTLFASITGQF